jgi:hypothetical protein
MLTIRFARRHHRKGEAEWAKSFRGLDGRLAVKADDAALAFGQPG